MQREQERANVFSELGRREGERKGPEGRMEGMGKGCGGDGECMTVLP